MDHVFCVWTLIFFKDNSLTQEHYRTTLLSRHVLFVVCVQVYGVFYATSFLDLYRSPRQVTTSSLSLTVTVDSDEQYLFLVSLLLILNMFKCVCLDVNVIFHYFANVIIIYR